MMTINIYQDYSSTRPHAPTSNLVFPKRTDSLATYLLELAAERHLILCRAAVRSPRTKGTTQVVLKIGPDAFDQLSFGIEFDAGMSCTILMHELGLISEAAVVSLFDAIQQESLPEIDFIAAWIASTPQAAGAVLHFESRFGDRVIGLVNP